MTGDKSFSEISKVLPLLKGAIRVGSCFRKLLNSSSLKKSVNFSISGRVRCVCSKSKSIGTFRSMVARYLLFAAISLPFSNFSFRLLEVILSMFSRTFSTLPNSSISFTAVFSPIPLTPGILSEESPLKPFKSVIFSGQTPIL